ncbi:uncharacterized protein VP01_1172g1 [Puccinia sorghi]|uniref:Uncharacterized protein n=1 Tax=Puccinia sorghi TaxID=27349 RepID=A0A0L6VR81_9BASI|nr:uncharacterized protein VP01_1172g1 [Puccinia sorghi]
MKNFHTSRKCTVCFHSDCKTTSWTSNDGSYCKGKQNPCEIFYECRLLAGTSIFWQKENSIQHGPHTLCETRWYLMARVCLGVQSHKGGFQICPGDVQGPPTHFTANQILISLLKPVVDTIAKLEQSKTTLADIWKDQ